MGTDARTTNVPGSDEQELDFLTIGRRIRHFRAARGMTLAQLGDAVGRGGSLISLVETGKREVRLSLLGRIAAALEVTIDQLLAPAPPSRRAALEIALEKAQRGTVFRSLGLEPLRVGKAIPTEAIETIVALHAEIERMVARRAATPEEARRANAQLRAVMRERDNYFPDLEAKAEELVDVIGHDGGPLSHRQVSQIAAHLGFALHYVPDLPHSTRSVTDVEGGRVFLPQSVSSARDPRSVVLQALADVVLEHREPAGYDQFLRQRVEANYLAAAMLLPRGPVVRMLNAAKSRRELSIEDLRDAYAVPYEIAAHRFTNLATVHLGLQVHFLKVHYSGAVHKAYENDGLPLPTDAMGAVEGQIGCRKWAARRALATSDRLSPFYQITDTPAGTFWCTARVVGAKDGEYGVSVGVPFDHSRWFRGRETSVREVSACPDHTCCRVPPPELAARWAGRAWPAARPHASLLAALPTGTFPGVDVTEVYSFLDRHTP